MAGSNNDSTATTVAGGQQARNTNVRVYRNDLRVLFLGLYYRS